MKKFRKVMVLLLALSMIMSGFVFAFAEDADTGAAAATVEATEPSAEEVIDNAEEEALTHDALSALQKPANILSTSSISSNSVLGISSEGDKLTSAGYRSILIMGIDNGRRSDILIVLVLKKNSSGTYDGKIFTVPRDTYLAVQKSNGGNVVVNGVSTGYCRANQAYANDGKIAAMRMLNRNLDLNIKECIAINWQCAADLITALNKTANGNITNASMLNAINASIKGTNAREKINTPAVSRTGSVALLGWQAVEYLRVRKYDGGSTLVRETRNRTMLRTLFAVAKAKNLDQRKDVMYQLANVLDTNMGEDSLALVSQISGISDGGSFPSKTTTRFDAVGKHNVRVPNTLVSNAKTLHSKMYPGVKYKPSSTVNSISKNIASRSKKVLKKNGSLSNAKVTVSNKTYDGKRPAITVTFSGIKLVEGVDYTLSGASTNVGQISFKVVGDGENFTGSKSGSYTVNPLGTSLTGVTAGSKSLSVTWTPQTTKMSANYVTGYEIQTSLSSNFKKSKKTTKVNGYSASGGTVTKLKSGKTYYVHVRTFMKVGKKTYYSGWSGAKSVRVN